MKFTAAAVVAFMAVAANAIPTENIHAVRTWGHDGGDNGGHDGGDNGGNDGGDTTNVCSVNQSQVCCNGILGCAVSLLGGGCTGSAFCCETEAPHGALISISLLNCIGL